MEESRKVYGWLVRDRNAAAECSSMWGDTIGGECQTTFPLCSFAAEVGFSCYFAVFSTGHTIARLVRHNTYFMVFNNPIDGWARIMV